MSRFARYVAVAFCMGALAPSVSAQEKLDRVSEAMKNSAAVVDFYPKPWPLQNLVKAGVLTVTVSGEAPPGDFVDAKTGELTGFINDLYLKLGEDLGLKVEFIKLPFSSALVGLKSNRFDMACATASWTTQRLATQDFFMTSPISITGILGVAGKDSGVTSWEAIKGKRMGGVQGEVYIQDAQKKLSGFGPVIEYPGMPEAVLALKNKQVDFLVSNSNIIRYVISSPANEDMQVIGPPISVYPGGMCVNPREPDLLKAVNVLLANYRADGTLKRIYAKYGVPESIVDLLTKLGY